MITPQGFGSSQPRFLTDQKTNHIKKKPTAVRRNIGRGRLKKDKWANATLYVRTKPWDTATPPPRNALVLVEKIIPGEEGDDDEIEYETFFYSINGKLIKKLNTTISLDNNNDFKARDYAHIKKILAGKAKGFEHNAQGAVPTDLSQYGINNTEEIIHDLISIARDRAKAKKRTTYGIGGGICIATAGLIMGCLVFAGVIDLPNWLSVISLVSGGFALGKTVLTLYYDHKNKCLHKTKSLLCPNSDCCSSTPENQLESLAASNALPAIDITLNIAGDKKQTNEQDSIAQRMKDIAKNDNVVGASDVRLEMPRSPTPDPLLTIGIASMEQQAAAKPLRNGEFRSAFTDLTSPAAQQRAQKRSPSPDLLAPKRRSAPVATPAFPVLNIKKGAAAAIPVAELAGAGNSESPSMGARTKRSNSLKSSTLA